MVQHKEAIQHTEFLLHRAHNRELPCRVDCFVECSLEKKIDFVDVCPEILTRIVSVLSGVSLCTQHTFQALLLKGVC